MTSSESEEASSSLEESDNVFLSTKNDDTASSEDESTKSGDGTSDDNESSSSEENNMIEISEPAPSTARDTKISKQEIPDLPFSIKEIVDPDFLNVVIETWNNCRFHNKYQFQVNFSVDNRF